MKKLGTAVRLGLIAALLGGIAGGVSAGFLRFTDWGQNLLWNGLATNLPLQTLCVCTMGGFLVGVCQRYLGDHPQNLYQAVDAIRKTGRLDYTHLPQGLIAAAVSLIFGASLGPEAAIVDLIGGLSTWVGDAISALRKRFDLTSPIPTTNRVAQVLHRWPNLIALVVGIMTFFPVLGGLYSGGFLKLSEPFQWSDLLWSIPVAIVGAAGGYLYLALQTRTTQWVKPLEQKPILRGMLGGFFLGLIALFLPLVLFSGQHALQQAYNQSAQLGFWILILIVLARLFLTNLLLASGWKGGQFFPIMFGGATLGISVSVLFPSIPAPVAALGAMASLTAVVLPKPIIAVILMALLFPFQYVGVSMVAVGIVIVGQRLWNEVARQLLPKGRALQQT